MPPNQTNPYTLHTALEPNQVYSCFGIKLKVKEQVDTFSNSGNFSIHINNINLKELESKGKGITKDTPIFCYVQESKQTHIAKLQDKTTSINIQLDTNLPKDSNNNLIPIIPKLIFLSFIPFRDSKEANNSPSQKIQLTADDINKGYYNVDFMIPLMCFGEWDGNGEWEEILTPLPQRYASNDDMAIIDLIKWQTSKKVRLLFYGGARKIGDNSAFYYASLNVLNDYKKHYPNDIYKHKFIDSAKTIVDIINAQKPNSIASLDLFFYGSKWGLYMYKGSSMSKNLSKDDIQANNLNAGLYASKTTDLLSARDTHEEERTIYDIKFDRFVVQRAYIEIHGCESGGDLFIIDSIAKNLSEEIPQGYVVGHITKANPNIDNTTDIKKQDYRHGKRAIWKNGEVIKETLQKRWINLEELLQ